MLEGHAFTFRKNVCALRRLPPVYTSPSLRKCWPNSAACSRYRSVAQRYKSSEPLCHSSRQLDDVFQAAIRECRTVRASDRSSGGTSSTLEYVTDKPWSDTTVQRLEHSLIQINTDPDLIDRAVDLAAHEGYPAITCTTHSSKHILRGRSNGSNSRCTCSSAPVTHREEREFRYRGCVPARSVPPSNVQPLPLADLIRGNTRYYDVHRLTGVLNYAHNEAARGTSTAHVAQAGRGVARHYALMSTERSASSPIHRCVPEVT